MRGRVKWWCPGEGYGFIECENEENVFVHLNVKESCIVEIDENQEIEFTLEEINNNTYLNVLSLIVEA